MDAARSGSGRSVAPPMELKVVKTSGLQEFAGMPERTAIKELGLYEATHSALTARRVKIGKAWSIDEILSHSEARFTLIYVLAGSLMLQLPSKVVSLHEHDAVIQIPLSQSSIAGVSGNLEFLEIQALESEWTREHLPAISAHVLCMDRPDIHIKGAGPRSFFDYRDLGAAKLTGGQVEVQIIRAQKAREGGTGWHSHDMAQLSYGLSGWALLNVEGCDEPVRQEPGDALSIPAGCRHNAGAFSDDYWALQLQLPADYETVAREAPTQK